MRLELIDGRDAIRDKHAKSSPSVDRHAYRPFSTEIELSVLPYPRLETDSNKSQESNKK